MSETRSPPARSIITRIFSRSRDQPNNTQDGHEEEIRRITEQSKAAETQLQMTQDKLHHVQEKLHSLEVDYRRQSVELREAGVAKEEWRNDQRRLEEQLRKKDEEIRIQDEALMKSRRDYQHLEAMLKDARDSLTHKEMKLQEQSRSHEEEIKRVEGGLNLEKMAIEQRFEKLDSEYKKLESKYIALNEENVKLCEEIHINSHNPPVVPTVNPHEYTQHVGKTHECWKLCAFTLLSQNDDLLQNMANNLLPSCINGSTCDWIHLCKALKINSESLSHVDSKARLINIIQHHRQQTYGPPMTVRFLYDTLKSIKAKRAAGLLREKARFVYEQRKRSASEGHIQGPRKHHNLAKSSASFSYASRQNPFFLDSLSESESESEGLKITTVPISQSLSTMSSIDGESIEITNQESPRNV